MQILKIALNDISRINYVVKKQNSIKGLNFGDRKNIIDNLISTGVECEHVSDAIKEVVMLIR